MDTRPAPPARTPGARHGRTLAAAALAVAAVATAACGSATADDADGAAVAPAPTSADPSAAPTTVVQEGPGTGASYFAGTEVPVSLTLPAGWSTEDVFVVREGSDPAVALSFYDVANVYSDPCGWVLLDPPLGPGVDDLVTALSSSVFAVDDVRDVELDGHAGQRLRLTVPDYDPATCTSQRFGLWKEDGATVGPGTAPNLWAQAPGQQLHVWAVDVDGSRLVVGAMTYPDTAREDLATIEEIVGSLEIG